MRILSLLPSATEIVAGLGLQGQLVGVSHCCDYPSAIVGLPQVTSSVVDPSRSSREIDQTVREHLSQQSALYELDTELLEELKPDLVVTQALCDVCAVSGEDVEVALDSLSTRPQIVNLEPFSLDEVLNTIVQIGAAAGQPSAAEQQVSGLRQRIEAVRERTARCVPDPAPMLLLDWFDPPFVSGHWMQDIISLAGGKSVLEIGGVPSRRVDWLEIERAAPEAIVLSCCGFTASRTRTELASSPQGDTLQALVDTLGVPLHIVDGNSLFARPGPRLVDSLELLAHLLHPSIHPYRNSFHNFL
jgi:iron complex transport system substrate-binding protein